MAVSPDIMAMLGGGGGAPPAPAPAPADAPASGGSGDNVDFLRQAIDAAKQYADGEDDEVHVQTALQCIAKLQSILAEEQKSQDGLLQGKADPRAMRRATSGSY